MLKKISDKDLMIRRAYAYSEKHFVTRQERDAFMNGIKYVMKRLVWE